MAPAPRKTARILRPIPYGEGPYGEGDAPQVAPVGAYEVAEEGEHLHFFSEDAEPFRMHRSHAVQHHRAGHLQVEDWES